MPLIERTKESMRTEFVERVLAHEKSKSALCREYGISRPTGDKWIKQYLSGEGLADKSKAPHNPNRIATDIEKLVVAKRNEFPAFGAVKIGKMLITEGYENIPCTKTINNIFQRNGLITKEDSQAAKPHQRFVKDYPNEMWQADYKGNFLMKNGERCHPLNIIDDYSRFNICCRACKTETFDEIKPIMIELFEEYGQPFSFLCDNGNPWGTSQSTGFTKFEVWLMELGILTIHGRIHHPQTQGKDERFNRSFTRECLRYNEFNNIEEAQSIFDEYRNVYNNIRPHHSLNLDVPSQHYIRSNKEYNPDISTWEYPENTKFAKLKKPVSLTLRIKATSLVKHLLTRKLLFILHKKIIVLICFLGNLKLLELILISVVMNLKKLILLREIQDLLSTKMCKVCSYTFCKVCYS